jgi:hypothetical protein
VKFSALIAAIAGVCLTSAAFAQNDAQQSEDEPVYFPLFSEAMIQSAPPEQAARMRETEARSRQAFDKRQQAIRDRNAKAQEDAARQARERALASTTRRQQGKNKVYKWVDADGRVHFGDAPRGQDAKEVSVGGVARIKGAPPPPPGRSDGMPKPKQPAKPSEEKP